MTQVTPNDNSTDTNNAGSVPKLTPLRDWVVLTLDTERETESGIILAEEKVEVFGTVVAVGALVETIEKGQRVMVDPYSYFEHEVDGTMLAFIAEKDIVAIL